ncbi:MAG: Alcohol dehydrogenase zinc-binding domain protein [Solirubrobacterales bacterium]|nr:Alcohol dehydrogenase zinc-binding domain protein [Solirubrobacterales bacterium]
MRAAVIERLGEAPRVADVPEPARREGDALLRVRAAALNPVDLSISRGGFYRGAPETPYVPGGEGVGEVIEADGLEPGTLAYFDVAAGFDGRGGSFAELVAVPRESLVPIPDGLDPGLAVGFGTAGLAAWLGLGWRGGLREGERVLVLGASGAVGQIAVQAAKLLGAVHVVAAARSEAGLERARELGADATVRLDGDREAVTERLRAAAEGDLDLAFDPLWGEPALAAFAALAPFGRLVQIGQSAAPEASLASSVVRGRSRAILGHSNFLVPREVRAAAYRRLVEHVTAGELTVDYEALPLERVAEAWERQASSPGRKLVLVL